MLIFTLFTPFADPAVNFDFHAFERLTTLLTMNHFCNVLRKWTFSCDGLRVGNGNIILHPNLLPPLLLRMYLRHFPGVVRTERKCKHIGVNLRNGEIHLLEMVGVHVLLIVQSDLVLVNE